MSWLSQFDSISGNNNNPFSWINTGGTSTNEVCTDQPKMENGEYVTTPSGSIVYEEVCRDNEFDDNYGRNRNNSRIKYDGTSVPQDCEAKKGTPLYWSCQSGKCPQNPTDPVTNKEIEDGCEQNVIRRMREARRYSQPAATEPAATQPAATKPANILQDENNNLRNQLRNIRDQINKILN